MNRRKLFTFLATSPLAAVAAIAQAKQPTEISADRINLGEEYEMVTESGKDGEKLHIRRKYGFIGEAPCLTLLPPGPRTWLGS